MISISWFFPSPLFLNTLYNIFCIYIILVEPKVIRDFILAQIYINIKGLSQSKEIYENNY